MSAEIAKGIVKNILTYDEKLYASSVDHENPLDVEDSKQNDKNPSDQRKDNDSNTIEDNKVIIKGKENKDPVENVIGEDAVSEEKIDLDEKIERTKKKKISSKEEEVEEKEEEKEEEEEEEIYEVEAIIDHKKSGNRMKYFIKWKGYPKNQSTWELDKNIFAEDLIKDYWEKLEMTKSSEDVKSPVKSRTTATGSKNMAPTTPRKDRKRASTSSPSVNQESKNQHTPKKVKIEEIKNEPDDNTSDNWDDEVVSVETVSRDEKSGELSVYLKWNDGNTSRHPAKEANIRCPQKMIKFYEQRLTFSN